MSIIGITKELLIKKLDEAICGETLAAFIGSGLSIPAGFLSWKDLLREPANEINLDVEKESYDLVNLAQYYCNENSRTAIDEIISNNFIKLCDPTRNHFLLSQLPISTYWTTNYDQLIEKALEKTGKISDVKLKDSHLRSKNKASTATIYKMHGDASDPSTAVLTRTDYEQYGYDERRLFREVLDGDLLTKTFLFLGYSFSDPNLNYVISRLRVLLNTNGNKHHYCIMKREKSENGEKSYNQIKQELQIKDLERYQIKTYLIEDFTEVEEILQCLVNKYRRKTVFISGSAYSYKPFSDDDGKKLISQLAFKLSEKGYNILNGFGYGVGTYVINGVAKYCYYSKKKKIDDILTLMPFPQEGSDGIDVKKFYTEYRKLMLEKSGIAVFLFGNNSRDEVASGVMEEYKIASELGVISIPIYLTGGAANNIYDSITVEHERGIIQNANGEVYEVDEIIENVIKVIDELNKGD